MAYGKKFYVFKGGITESDVGIIAAFNTVTKEWKKSGKLNVGRFGHGVIESQGDFIVIGGDGFRKRIEQCTLENDESMQCKLVEPELDSTWSYYPQLMLVPNDYCSK